MSDRQQVTHTIEGPGYTRRDITFPSHESDCAAWVYMPDAAQDAPSPVIVMAHGLGAVRQLRLHEFAERFAQSGYAAVVFDYRHFGASGGQPRQLVDIRRQLEDWHSALAYVRADQQFDKNRIALWGSSFGGGHVLQVAAEDRAVRAVISQCPFTDGPASLAARIRTGIISAPIMLIAGLIDYVGSATGREPLLLPMVGTPLMPAFLAAPDSLPGAVELAPAGAQLSARTAKTIRRFPSIAKSVSAAHWPSTPGTPRPSDDVWGVLEASDGTVLMRNAIAARLVLKLPLYRPGRTLEQHSIPTLICLSENDTVAPAATTIRHAYGLKHVEVKPYATGHFEIYVGNWFEQVSTDQINFLAQHIPATAQSGGQTEPIDDEASKV